MSHSSTTSGNGLEALLSAAAGHSDDDDDQRTEDVRATPKARAGVSSTRESAIDDTRFSTVPLSAELERTHVIDEQSLNTKETDDTVTESASISDAATLTSGNTPFLVKQLEQKHGSPNAHTRRLSKEGEEQLQYRFSKIQNGLGSDDGHDFDAGPEIDWDYHQFASDRSGDLAKAIERGIPHTLRGMMWQLMSASKDADLEQAYAEHLKNSSPHEKAIMRDLGRTFPHHEYFMDGSGVGQENLFNVLKAYSLHDTAVGYCQGLPFVVAILLLNMPDEEAFCLLVRLMQSYDLRGHFVPEMPGLQLRLFQFERLVEEMLPVLHIHFLRQGVKSSMFASQWFLTMFSYRFPLDFVFRIFDNCLATGIEAMFRFGLVLLVKNEDLMLELKFDDLLSFFKSHLLDRYRVRGRDSTNLNRDEFRVDEFVEDAFRVRITPFMLDSYAHEWEEVIRVRDAHAIEVDTLRNANRALQQQVKKLEDNLLQLNEEHCEVAKQLVLARIQHEELESELVRYKLLYADAMHQNEESMSGHARSNAELSRQE